ncbi:MAG: T9SS type A sorting domain-containing protein [Bacteroidales bacterium]|jgi:hypothetical protein|nr:T9SS type A sorting domain-containing protein [Bacteroidales bacterium]
MTKEILLILFTVFALNAAIQQATAQSTQQSAQQAAQQSEQQAAQQATQQQAQQSAQQAKPELRPLSHNAQLNTHQAKAQLKARRAIAQKDQGTMLTLPFIDDFSAAEHLPDPTKWVEPLVFINRTFGIFPPTTGVATFDALNENGEIYPDANEAGSIFEADVLTSQTIRLDSIFIPYPKALSPADSVMLSFYFQPGGGIGSSWGGEQIGYRPAFEDRLILEFYSNNDTFELWQPVWETTGMSLKEMCPICDSAQYPQQQKNFFTRVVVPISEQNFYSKNFKFRFRAYSSINTSLKTGGGQWHIDYVYLDAGRTQNEKAVGDVAFVDVPQTLLNGYTAVPYNQLKSTIIKNSIPLKVTNLSAAALSCRYYNTITDIATGREVSREPQTGEANANIYPYNLNGFYTNPDISTQPQKYLFPDVINGDGEKQYLITHVLKSGILTDLVPANDTVRTTQVFGREFAFDDGTSEQGMGFTSAKGRIAGAFTLHQQDTFAGLNICFNKSYNDYNEVSFNIYLWTASATDTIPEDSLYCGAMRVHYSDENNGFTKYHITDTLILPPATYFWGIEQTTAQFLNIGFDQNNNASKYTRYYYYNSDIMSWEWQTPFYYGAAMVRPFFGAPQATGNEVSQRVIKRQQLKVFPNPATTDVITLQFPMTAATAAVATAAVFISDVSGRTVLATTARIENGQSTISIKTLPRGIYFIKAGVYNAKIIVW